MSNDLSITRLFNEANSTQDENAVLVLYSRFRNAVLAKIRRTMSSVPHRIADPEDVEQNVLVSLIQGLRQGDLPQIKSRNELWVILLRCAGRHAQRLVRREQQTMSPERLRILEQAQKDAQESLAPDKIVEFAELTTVLNLALPLLRDKDLKRTALRNLQGYTDEEIAAEMGLPLPTVTRRLAIISELWNTME